MFRFSIGESRSMGQGCIHVLREKKKKKKKTFSYVWKSISKQALRILVACRIARLSPRGHSRRDHFVKLHGLLGSIDGKGQGMVEGRNTTRMYPELEEEDCQPLPRGRRGRKGRGRESTRRKPRERVSVVMVPDAPLLIKDGWLAGWLARWMAGAVVTPF